MSRYMNSHKVLTAINFAMKSLQGVLRISISMFVSILTEIISKGEVISIPFITVFGMIYSIFVAAVIYMSDLIEQKWLLLIKKDIELDVLKTTIRHSPGLSSINNIYNNEINLVINNYFGIVSQMVYTILSFVVALFYGLYISWEVVVFCISTVLISIAVNQLFSKKLNMYMEAFQQSNRRLTAILASVYKSILEINIFGAHKLSKELVEKGIDDRIETDKKNQYYICYAEGISTILSFLIQIGTIVLLLILNYLERLELSQVFAFFILTQYLVSPLNNMLFFRNSLAGCLSVRRSLLHIIDEKTDENMEWLPEDKITIKELNFSYGNEPFMQGVNLIFKPGEKYLILGKSGSGKTTLLKLLLKETEVYSGNILFGEKDIKQISKVAYYQHFSYVGQDINLLPTTIAENIALRKEYDHNKLMKILDITQLDYLADKIDEKINESQSNLSGGELQRIAIARVLYQNRSICIFDEFTSSIDNTISNTLEKYILGLEGKMVVNISHKYHEELLKYYDRIIILDKGVVAYQGQPLSKEEIEAYYV